MALQTERLTIRHLTLDDAAFILALLNEPSFLRYIGDRNVRTLNDAVRYIENGPLVSYQRYGFGLYCVVLTNNSVPIGMCGLLKRPALSDPDLGFAFLPTYWSQGYACEAASAVMAEGRNTFGINRVVAIASPDNFSSIKLLEKLGLRFERLMTMPGDNSAVKCFVLAD